MCLLKLFFFPPIDAQHTHCPCRFFILERQKKNWSSHNFETDERMTSQLLQQDIKCHSLPCRCLVPERARLVHPWPLRPPTWTPPPSTTWGMVRLIFDFFLHLLLVFQRFVVWFLPNRSRIFFYFLFTLQASSYAVGYCQSKTSVFDWSPHRAFLHRWKKALSTQLSFIAFLDWHTQSKKLEKKSAETFFLTLRIAHPTTKHTHKHSYPYHVPRSRIIQQRRRWLGCCHCCCFSPQARVAHS